MFIGNEEKEKGEQSVFKTCHKNVSIQFKLVSNVFKTCHKNEMVDMLIGNEEQEKGEQNVFKTCHNNVFKRFKTCFKPVIKMRWLIRS